MSSRMEYSTVLIDAFHVDSELFFEDIDLIVYGQGCR